MFIIDLDVPLKEEGDFLVKLVKLEGNCEVLCCVVEGVEKVVGTPLGCNMYIHCLGYIV